MPCMNVTAHKTATSLGKNISATQVLVPAGKQHPTSLSTSELLLQPCQLLIVVSNNTSRTAGSISLQYKSLIQFHIINFPPMLSFHSGLFFFFHPWNSQQDISTLQKLLQTSTKENHNPSNNSIPYSFLQKRTGKELHKSVHILVCFLELLLHQ